MDDRCPLPSRAEHRGRLRGLLAEYEQARHVTVRAPIPIEDISHRPPKFAALAQISILYGQHVNSAVKFLELGRNNARFL